MLPLIILFNFPGGDREAPGQRSVLHRARQGGPSRLLRLHHLGRRKQVSITFEIPAQLVLKYSSSSSHNAASASSRTCTRRAAWARPPRSSRSSARGSRPPSPRPKHSIRFVSAVGTFIIFVHYRAGLRSGLQVARIFQPSLAISGKQQQDPNSPSLGPTC